MSVCGCVLCVWLCAVWLCMCVFVRPRARECIFFCYVLVCVVLRGCRQGLLFKVNGVADDSAAYAGLGGAMLFLCTLFLLVWLAVIVQRILPGLPMLNSAVRRFIGDRRRAAVISGKRNSLAALFFSSSAPLVHAAADSGNDSNTAAPSTEWGLRSVARRRSRTRTRNDNLKPGPVRVDTVLATSRRWLPAQSIVTSESLTLAGQAHDDDSGPSAGLGVGVVGAAASGSLDSDSRDSTRASTAPSMIRPRGSHSGGDASFATVNPLRMRGVASGGGGGGEGVSEGVGEGQLPGTVATAVARLVTPPPLPLTRRPDDKTRAARVERAKSVR